MTQRPTQDRHTPVLLTRVVELLAPALAEPGAVYVDGTLGMGGHAEAILRACPKARAVGIDRDPQALELAGRRLASFADRFTAVAARYDEIDTVLADLGLSAAQAVLLDLGVSSVQLDETDRGFAYRVDAPLDMRMDPALPLTAADILNTYDAAGLTDILRRYGEERFAGKISRAIVAERASGPFTTSARLVDLLHRVIPAAARAKGGHPAKRTFQALRIEVNGELSGLAAALPRAIEVCAPGGRVAVLSYHSLEDRMVKKVFAAGATSSAPPGLPVELPEHRPYLRLLTRGAQTPTEDEVARNARAASVRLRAVERTAATPPGRSAALAEAAWAQARRGAGGRGVFVAGTDRYVASKTDKTFQEGPR